MLFPPKIRNWLFIAFAILTLISAGYHFLDIFYPFDKSPVWRHILFIGINLFCTYGVLKRPKYFVYFFAVLLVQQYYSHGSFLVNLWIEKGQIHWISVIDLLLMPIGLICLVDDYRMKRSQAGPTQKNL